MDAFETRMQFLNQLRRLTSARQSIDKVVSFLLMHSSAQAVAAAGSGSGRRSISAAAAAIASTHAEADLWECIVEELEKASINARMNIFYMLDSLLDQSLAIGFEAYRQLVKTDLSRVVGLTVPQDVREGVLNRMSTMQVLNGWRTRRLLPATLLDPLLNFLQSATFPLSGTAVQAASPQAQGFSRTDILRRIEDDRERHKRLRERSWVLPIAPLGELTSSTNHKLSTVLGTAINNSPASPASPASADPKLVSLAAYAREGSAMDARKSADLTDSLHESALDVEFEQAWTARGGSCMGSIFSEDIEAMEAENAKCFGHQ